MTTALIIPIKGLPAQIEIAPAWLEQRDEALAVARAVTVVENQQQFDSATEVQASVSKLSSALEKMRLELGRPFRDADALIKRRADEARRDLEAEKERLKALNAAFARADLLRKQQEAARIEAENRRRAEEAAEANRKAQEEARKAQEEAAKAAAELGLEAAPVVVPVAEVVPVEIVAPTVATAKAGSAAVQMVLRWEYVDAEAVPRAFCTPDDRKVNGWLRDNKERVKAAVKAGEQPIDGVRFWEDVDVRSR